jgi:hypothetical protein
MMGICQKVKNAAARWRQFATASTWESTGRDHTTLTGGLALAYPLSVDAMISVQNTLYLVLGA